MEDNASAEANFLLNLQQKLLFLEEKATHAKQLMEKAALLSIIKLPKDQTDTIPSQVEALNEKSDSDETTNTQDLASSEVASEMEQFHQKEELLHALMGCISDLENLDVTFDLAGKDRQSKLNSLRILDEEISKQGILVQALKEQSAEPSSQNSELAQKFESTKDVLQQLSAEKTTFEQTLLGLEVLLQASTKLRGEDVPQSEDTTVKEDNMNEAVKSENAPNEPIKLEDDESPLHQFQQQIRELQSAIEQLEGAVRVRPSSTPEN